MLLVLATHANASPPASDAALPVSPDTYQRYIGVVTKARVVTTEVGTSDVTSEKRRFKEVSLKVASAETVTIVEPEPPKTLAERPAKPVETSVPFPEPAGKIVIFYFATTAKVRVGERLMVETATANAISQGWMSGAYNARFKSLDRPVVPE